MSTTIIANYRLAKDIKPSYGKLEAKNTLAIVLGSHGENKVEKKLEKFILTLFYKMMKRKCSTN